MAMRAEILSWLRRRRERARRIDADSDMFIRELGSEAYAEARIMQRQARSTEERRHWRDIALAIARKTNRRTGLEDPAIEPRDVDPIDELKRVLGRQEPEPPREAKASTFRWRGKGR
jgi:hypothetical protein